ncbi:hypothetical protein CIHG_10510 [Coccidioides immitis H538.4]|uniref:Uncharacterized protein n=2 Tax=Coccidioides immitis TaxID=5501 RepID=A0A0J8S6H3_COCIT|nr:hypothetical protein CIRG_09868 [Coccidioides immitis RMSCC 2394]KMU92737.1 hypothetical protein CIHG_10510 [Coccidioides immitis H538.4]
MAQNSFSNLKNELAVQLDKFSENADIFINAETENNTKTKNDTAVNESENIVHKQVNNFYYKIFGQTCSQLEYSDMTDLDLDNLMLQKIQQMLGLLSLKKLVITSKAVLVT